MEQTMNSQDILRMASNIYNERGKQYGDIEVMFDTAAAIATMMTGREFSKYDVTVVMEAIKMARRRVNPTNPDNYVDGINYATFSAQFAKVSEPIISDHISIEADIVEFAKKFSPVKKESEGA
jgi:hypothetical protein